MAVPARRAVRELSPRPEIRPRLPLAPIPSRGRPAARPSRTTRPAPRARRVPFLLFSGLVVAALVLLLVSAQALVAQGAFRLSDLGRRADRLEVETDLLRLEVAELASPDRITAAARRAGLVQPRWVEVLGP